MQQSRFVSFAFALASLSVVMSAAAEPPLAPASDASEQLNPPAAAAAPATPPLPPWNGELPSAPAQYGPLPVVRPWPIMMLPAPELERRSSAAMATGIALSGVGALAFMYVGATAMNGSESIDENGERATTTHDDQHDRVARGAVIGGLVCLAVGIPLIIYGAKRVPAQPAFALAQPLPSWAGSPTTRGWGWRF